METEVYEDLTYNDLPEWLSGGLAIHRNGPLPVFCVEEGVVNLPDPYGFNHPYTYFEYSWHHTNFGFPQGRYYQTENIPEDVKVPQLVKEAIKQVWFGWHSGQNSRGETFCTQLWLADQHVIARAFRVLPNPNIVIVP